MQIPQIGGKRVSGYLGLLALFLWALYLLWLLPAPEWQHVEERAFILHPLGFWSGDFNPHFFNYPALHFHLASVLYYFYYLMGDKAQAVALLERAIKVKPSAQIYMQSGILCDEIGQHQQAKAYEGKVTDLYPDAPQAAEIRRLRGIAD